MRRRRMFLLAAVALIAASGFALAQAPRVAHIGWLSGGDLATWELRAVFTDAMRERGWVEGTHYVVDAASCGGRADRVPAAAAEVLARKPDLVIGSGTPTMRALMAKTTLPIDMYSVASLVEQGFVASLSHPGGNVIGIAAPDGGLLGEQFEMLPHAAPAARRIGVVYSTDAVHFFLQPWFAAGSHAARLAAIAEQQRWRTAMALPPRAHAGILLTYGFRQEDRLRRLAYYVDRILKGTPPGELPVEQPTRIYLALNLKTARALGLTLPQSVLLLADEVIE
jgi:putative ABC transport system substrate-binding protein